MITPLPTTSEKPSPTPSSLSPPHRSPLLTHLLTPITPTLTSLPLLLSTFISGLADSASYNAWSAFVSMQTGNTVFLALGASSQPLTRPYGWLKSLTSIVFFSTSRPPTAPLAIPRMLIEATVLGCAFFARLMRAPGHGGRTRLALAGSFAIQAAMMFTAAGLATGKVVPTPDGLVSPPANPPMFIELVPLALLAFQAGGQIVASRVLGHSEIPTTVLTSVYCDLTSDAGVLKGDNAVRDRRLMGVVCLVLGGIVGGWVSRSEAGLGTVFWVGGGLKCVLVGAWLGWGAEREGEEGKGNKRRRGW
ncbi:hypothetical protein MMC27_001183 [Xylographa pallens]|nr:hypothetical protein [Xylographa pallens]